MQKRLTISGRPSGFTLIEFLAVIAVLGVLAAVLFPVFATTRERARSAVCASNLHQVSLALRMYAGDWDGAYPPNNVYELRERRRLAWDLLIPYTHSRRIFHCPDETGVFGRALGYGYRAAIWNDPAAKLEHPLRPGSGSVVAICEQHAERSGPDGWALDASFREIGPLLVAREDGSVSRIPAGQVVVWAYQSGQWSPLSGLPACPAEAVCMARFPGEEWPPQME